MTAQRQVRSVLAAFGCVCGGAASAQLGPRAPKAETKPYSLTVLAAVPTATVMEDGFFLGNVGSSFDSAAGDHLLLVGASGYVPRLVHVRLVGSQLTAAITVGLVPVPEKHTEIELDFARAQSFHALSQVESLPSLCKRYHSAAAQLPPAVMLPCSQATVLDDLKAQNFAPLALQTAAGKSRALVAALAAAASDDFYWAAETAYRETPANAAAASILAYSALTRHDCVRTMEIAMETGAAQLNTPGLNFVRGLCLELAGSPGKAATLYQAIAAGAPATLPVMAYHASRASWQLAAPGAGDLLLDRCTRALPNFYPCFETRAQVLALRGQADAGRGVLSAYWNATSKAVADAVPRSGLPLDPARIASAQDQRPWSFELTAARIVTTDDPELAAKLLGTVYLTRIANVAAVRRLLPRFEARNQPKLVVIALEALAARSPQDTTIQIRLATAYREQQRCKESLAAADQAVRLLEEPERRAALIVSMTPCFLAEGRLAEAERLLGGVTRDYPENWRAAYNLGIVEERLGNTAAAMENYRQALQGDLSPQLAAKLQETLARHDHPSKKPKPGQGDADDAH